MTIEDLEIIMRRAIESEDDVTAAALAVEIDARVGDPPEDDRVPEPVPCWGCDAE